MMHVMCCVHVSHSAEVLNDLLRFVRQDTKNSKRPVLRQLGEFEIMQKVWEMSYVY